MSTHPKNEATSILLGAITSLGVGTFFLQALGAFILALIGAFGGWLFSNYFKPKLDAWKQGNLKKNKKKA